MRVRDGDPEYPIFYNEIYEEITTKVDPFARVLFGMSKCVITAPSLKGVVIKIPFSGTYECYFDDDHEDNDYVYEDDEYIFSPFSCAETKDGWDYCMSEYEKYKELRRRNLECFVAQTQFYNITENNLRVFLQEKIISREYDTFDRVPSLRSKDIAKQWQAQDLLTVDTTWLASCIDNYGESKTKRFLDYCQDKNYQIIADFHYGNYGYRNDGTPAILDYSGFKD